METIESIIRTATDGYIGNNVVKGCTDLYRTENELVHLIAMHCAMENRYRKTAGLSCIKAPSRLDFQQIAQILCAALYVRAVRLPDRADPELMLWDGRIYKPCPREIRLEALKLNGRLTKSDLNRVEQRMSLLAEPAVPESDNKCTAYRNGIVVSPPGMAVVSGHGTVRLEPGTLHPFMPEIVLLSIRDEAWQPGTEHGKED